MVLNQWKVERKAYNDKVQHERRKSLGTNTQSDIEHSGVLISQLRMMTEVQASPLLVSHTFYDKELLLLRIAEEANLSGCPVSSKTNITCNFDMEVLRATLEDRTMRYCPPYAAARKAGRPKLDKRLKSPLEGKSKRKRGDVNKGKTGGKRRSVD